MSAMTLSGTPEPLFALLGKTCDWSSALRELWKVLPAPDPAHPSIPFAFQRPGDTIVLMQPLRVHPTPWMKSFGQSVFAKTVLGESWGSAEGEADAETDENAHSIVQQLVEANFLRSACAVARGGVAVALSQASLPNKLGFRVNMFQPEYQSALHAYFSESPLRLLLTCDTHAHLAMVNFIERRGPFVACPIGRVTSGSFSLSWESEPVMHALAVSAA